MNRTERRQVSARRRSCVHNGPSFPWADGGEGQLPKFPLYVVAYYKDFPVAHIVATNNRDEATRIIADLGAIKGIGEGTESMTVETAPMPRRGYVYKFFARPVN